MPRSMLVPLCAALLVAACSDHDPITLSDSPAVASDAASTARERLAARLAVALADPVLRQEFADRFATSDAPERKLQFQALARADGNRLLTRLAAHGSSSVTDLLADLDAARGLEVYLPVPEHREAWQGNANFLVATVARDGERPVAFNSAGSRSVLSANSPPAVPVMPSAS